MERNGPGDRCRGHKRERRRPSATTSGSDAVLRKATNETCCDYGSKRVRRALLAALALRGYGVIALGRNAGTLLYRRNVDSLARRVCFANRGETRQTGAAHCRRSPRRPRKVHAASTVFIDQIVAVPIDARDAADSSVRCSLPPNVRDVERACAGMWTNGTIVSGMPRFEPRDRRSPGRPPARSGTIDARAGALVRR